jgi:vacuolar-type H+-ATPase subunit H
VRYQDRKTAIFIARTHAYHVPDLDRAGIVHWEEYQAQPLDTRRISGEPLEQAIYGDLPPGLTDAKRLTALRRELVDVLYNTARLRVPFNRELDVYGTPDADISEFRARATQVAREKRDAEIDALTTKYEAIISKLEDEMRRKGKQLETEKQELAEQRREELFTTGEAVLSLLQGRTAYTLSRMSRSALYRKRSQGDVAEFEQALAEADKKIAAAEQEFQGALQQVNDKWAKIAVQNEDYLITPFKKDITVDLFGIGWIPHWYVDVNGQPLLLPAFNG